MANLGRRIFAAGLLAAFGLIVGPGEAKAGITVGSTIIIPKKDPLAVLDFKLLLGPDTELIKGDYIDLKDVPGYDGTSSYVFMSGPIDYSAYFTIVTGAGSAAGLTDVELKLTANAPAALTNPDSLASLAIGDLYVETSASYPPPADSPLFDPISYTTRYHTLVPIFEVEFGGGTTTPTLAVPEPASMALVGAGLASTWLCSRARRRRRRAARGGLDDERPGGRAPSTA